MLAANVRDESSSSYKKCINLKVEMPLFDDLFLANYLSSNL